MSSFNNKTDFSHLLSCIKAGLFLQHLTELTGHIEENFIDSQTFERKDHLKTWKNEWQKLHTFEIDNNVPYSIEDRERAATDWLIQLFNTLFVQQNVILAHSAGEPEYFPAHNGQPARIEFAHGFFASALHEMHTSPYRLTC